MGEVYRARDTQLARDVAIKVLPAFLSNDPERLRRFEQEARAAAALNHPNILAVYQMGTYEGSPYLVSELLEGSTLRDLMKGGPLSSRKAIDYGAQIARGLAAAHEKGIVHRDLKPENLFVTKDGRVKILDFGLAKLMQRPQTDETAPTMEDGTDAGVVMGTVGYMAPEQVRGEPADHRADIFAFGAVLYEMLSGQRAFKKPTSAETMTAILKEEPPSMSQSSIGLTPGLQRIVHRCLEKAPEQRFQSASDLAFALEALSDSGSSSTIGAAATPEVSRKTWIWIGSAAGATAIAAALLVWWRSPPPVPVVESITQITDDGQPKAGTLVTDGSRVYFNEGPEGGETIMQVAVTGGQTVEIPTKLVNPSIEALSPDESQLLLGVGDFNLFAAPLWTMPLPAGEPRSVGSLTVSNLARTADGRTFSAAGASYAPDGRIVTAMGNSAADYALYAADADGSNPRKLFPYASNIRTPNFSPDGKHVVFSTFTVAQPNNTAILVEADPAGAAFHPFAKTAADSPSCCAQWTADGSYLVAQGESGRRIDLWAIPMQTGWFHRAQSPVRLTNGPMSFEGAVPARDGKHIFAIGIQERGEFLRYDVKSKQFLQFMPGISGLDPQFSADGQWMVYLSYPDQSLWRCRIDGSDALQLTYPPMTPRTPRISPDGKRISFEYGLAIYTIGMDGGVPEKTVAVTKDSHAASAHWSPDGNLLEYMAYFRQGGNEMRILDLSSGKTTTVPNSRGLHGVFVAQDKLVSPVGTGANAKLVIVDIDTGKRTDLASILNVVNWGPSRDMKSVYVVTGGSDPKALRVSIPDGKVDPIMDLKDLRRVTTPSMGVAPDDSLVFTRDIGTQEIYSLAVKWP